MELDVPTHSHNVLKGYLQGFDKQKEIELYYELLGSGHSVGEILNSLDHLQCNSEHGGATSAERSSSRADGEVPDEASEAAVMGVAPANTQHTPGLAAPVEIGSGRPDDSRHNELGSGDRLKFTGVNSPGPETNIDRSDAVHASADSDLPPPPDNQRLRCPGKFSVSAKQITIGALYTVAVASASIVSFAYMSGGPNADSAATLVQSGISSGTEAVAIRALTAGGSETVDENPKATTQVVNANSSSAREASRPADPYSAVPGSLRREAAQASITFPTRTSYIGQAEESSRQVRASAFNDHDAVSSETGRYRNISIPMGETGGWQIVRAFYTALERGDGEAASLLVIPQKREAGPFSAGELSNFYGRLELPFRLIGVDRAGENLYNVVYTYKVRNGRFCNGRSLVKTVSLRNQVLIEGIRSPSRC